MNDWLGKAFGWLRLQRAFIIPAFLIIAYSVENVLSQNQVMTLGIVWFLATSYGLVWTLLALAKSGESRARKVACWMLLAGFSPVIATPAHDAILSVTSFQYDAAVEAAIKAYSPHATQMVLSDRPLHHASDVFPKSEAIIYDSSDSIRMESDGTIKDFAPYSAKTKAHKIKWLRSHYYVIVKDSFTRISRLDIR
jgi:hypothetical protein